LPGKEELMASDSQVAVSRRIEARPEELFAILADPRNHLELDGSGMLRGAVTETPVTAVGDVFVMRMYYQPIGDYQMNNHVVEYQQDRRIGWEPESGRGHPDESTPDARWGQRWSFELTPDGPGATVVTHRYDCSRVPEADQAEMSGGRIWLEAMAGTLRRLDELVRDNRRRDARKQ
jgi:uncharacterized protein YndB with AHSA1/START domain